MKKIALVISLFIGFILAGCSAGVVVRRPADVTYVRPVSPGPGWVWISGDWVWRSGKYQWKDGYWHPAKPGRTWKNGYWEKDPDGYRWKKGRWQ